MSVPIDKAFLFDKESNVCYTLIKEYEVRT